LYKEDIHVKRVLFQLWKTNLVPCNRVVVVEEGEDEQCLSKVKAGSEMGKDLWFKRTHFLIT
jgi:hypothetical protein